MLPGNRYLNAFPNRPLTLLSNPLALADHCRKKKRPIVDRKASVCTAAMQLTASTIALAEPPETPTLRRCNSLRPTTPSQKTSILNLYRGQRLE